MKRKSIIHIACLLLGAGSIQAQEATTVAGGNANGPGGSSSYSVGQAAYVTHTGSSASVAEGVQQPYEISTTTGLDETDIALDLNAFPNPATDVLCLNIGSLKPEVMAYEIYDLEGKLKDQGNLTGQSTVFDLSKYPPSTYFLKVITNKQLVKTFKIIKK